MDLMDCQKHIPLPFLPPPPLQTSPHLMARAAVGLNIQLKTNHEAVDVKIRA